MNDNNLILSFFSPRIVFHLGRNYVLMGKVDEQGLGHLSPSSFALLYKPVHAKALDLLSRKSCWCHSLIHQPQWQPWK